MLHLVFQRLISWCRFLKDIDKVELALWVGVIIISLSILLGCANTKQTVKVHLFSMEMSSEVNTTKHKGGII